MLKAGRGTDVEFSNPHADRGAHALPKGRGTSVMETFFLELHHKIMLANKCSLDCKPVVAPMHFNLGGKCACIYMSVHVHIQKPHQKLNRTIS